MKIFDTKRLRVRKLTPKEYGILQAFPMDDWKQVVSDSQAYKQFGNAVTTTVFTAIAEEIAKSIYAAEESEEQNMEAENKNFTGMNEPEEKPTAESILAAAEAEAKVAAEREETTKTAIPAEETITPNSLANGMLQFLLDSGIVASACVTDETEKMFAKHIKEELDGITIGETPEILRDWEAAQNAVNDITAAANRELNRANEQFPLFTSKHEGVAVAYEELEESKEALEELEASFKCLWDDVRGKETPCYLKEEITPLKIADYAINLACEAVQTAAMLMKYEMSLNPAAEREGE